MTAEPFAPGSSRWRGARARRRAGWALLGIGVVALVLLVWGALTAVLVATRVQAASTHVREARSAVGQQDLPAARRALVAAAAQTSGAAGAASALPLVLASHAPGSAGRLVASLRTVVGAADQAVGDGALPLLQVASEAEGSRTLLREDGSVDVAAVSAAAERVRPAAAALAQARRRLAGVDPAALPGPLVGPVASARGAVDDLAAAARSAQSALTVLPGALGADGPRSYLVVFQNTAELRPTGGLVGTWALVRVADGRTHLEEVGADDDLDGLEGPPRDLGQEYRALYPPEEVRRIQNVNLSPDFPAAGQLLSDLWQAQGRPAPDAVIAADATGLAPLLADSGEIEVPGGPSITAGTVVDVLLRQVYVDFATDNDARKQYLSAVVGQAFEKALGGGAFTPAALNGMHDAVRDGHLVAWSRDAAVQDALVQVRAAGTLPAPSAGTAGVYLTNTSASKLDYYVTERVTTSGACGAAPPRLRVVLRSSAPSHVPDYVANKLHGVPRTTESLLVALYLPPQRGASQIRVDGRPVLVSAGSERGWSLARFPVQVPRGAATTVDVDLSGARTPVEHVLTQPLVEPVGVHAAGCS